MPVPGTGAVAAVRAAPRPVRAVTRKHVGTAVTRCGCGSAIRHVMLQAASSITGLLKTLQTSVVLHLDHYQLSMALAFPEASQGACAARELACLPSTGHRERGTGSCLTGALMRATG